MTQNVQTNHFEYMKFQCAQRRPMASVFQNLCCSIIGSSSLTEIPTNSKWSSHITGHSAAINTSIQLEHSCLYLSVVFLSSGKGKRCLKCVLAVIVLFTLLKSLPFVERRAVRTTNGAWSVACAINAWIAWPSTSMTVCCTARLTTVKYVKLKVMDMDKVLVRFITRNENAWNSVKLEHYNFVALEQYLVQ